MASDRTNSGESPRGTKGSVPFTSDEPADQLRLKAAHESDGAADPDSPGAEPQALAPQSGTDETSRNSAPALSPGSTGTRSLDSQPPGQAQSVLYKPNSVALIELAASTSFVLATFLVIPDAFAFIPNSVSLLSWALRLTGNWIAAAVIWFVSFLTMLHVVSFLVKGVEISSNGIRLWRLAKEIPWSKVEVIGCESQIFFSRLFALNSIAHRFTVFERKKARNGTTRLVPHYLPSFYFSTDQFESLCRKAYQQGFACRVNGIDAFLAREPGLPGMKKVYSTLKWQRLAFTILILVGLAIFVPRKATVLYAFNSGHKAAVQGDYVKAKQMYEWAAKTDPTFAPAWNDLARAEYILSDTRDAKEHWLRAILMKPDYVEPRIGLAHVAIVERDFKAAQTLLDKALSLNPLNPYALINRADLELQSGNLRAAMEDARLILSQSPDVAGPNRSRAACIFAEAKMRLGDPASAYKMLTSMGPFNATIANQSSDGGKRLVDMGQAASALNHFDEAAIYYRMAVAGTATAPIDKAQALTCLAQLEITKHNWNAASKLIKQSQAIVGNDAGLQIMDAQCELERGNSAAARKLLADGLKQPVVDTVGLVHAGQLLLRLNDSQAARACAERALKIEPENVDAKELLARLHS